MKFASIFSLVIATALPLACNQENNGSNVAASDLQTLSFKAKIAKVDCVLSVEDEGTASIPESSGPAHAENLGLMITVKDNNDASTCASAIADSVKGFQLRSVLSRLGMISARATANTKATPRNLEQRLSSVKWPLLPDTRYGVVIPGNRK